MVLPFVALVMVAVLQLVTVVQGMLVAQEAARLAARTAAVELDDRPVRDVVAALLEDATIELDPPGRRPGDVVTVEVTTTVRIAGVDTTVTGRAAMLVEPGAA